MLAQFSISTSKRHASLRRIRTKGFSLDAAQASVMQTRHRFSKIATAYNINLSQCDSYAIFSY